MPSNPHPCCPLSLPPSIFTGRAGNSLSHLNLPHLSADASSHRLHLQMRKMKAQERVRNMVKRKTCVWLPELADTTLLSHPIVLFLPNLQPEDLPSPSSTEWKNQCNEMGDIYAKVSRLRTVKEQSGEAVGSHMRAQRQRVRECP